jgi:anti-sigma factor RsiW
MNVTRDVIYDLLPAYFSGEASADTRTIVDEFFATDAEFARMAKRFQAAVERSSPADVEREAFRQTRARVGLRFAAMAWGAGALLAFGIAVVVSVSGGRPRSPSPGILIGVVFSAAAVATWLASYSRNSAWWYDALSGKTK